VSDWLDGWLTGWLACCAQLRRSAIWVQKGRDGRLAQHAFGAPGHEHYSWAGLSWQL